MSNDDTVTLGYKYYWSASHDSGLTLQEYLSKYKPSMVQNDGTKPWIWVRGSGSPKEQDNGGKEEAAVKEATAVLKEYAKKVDDIKNDNSIPVRANKKAGTRSKKEVREEVQAEGSQKLKDIAVKHGYVNGKWLIFAPADKVDIIWSSIAQSLVSGPLSQTKAYLAKVATSPQEEKPGYQHVICVYLPDIFDKEAVKEVMTVLLRNHGVNLSGAKADLYTVIGLDSKHESGIPSTIWKNTAILSDQDAKALKDQYFADLQNAATKDKEGASAVESAPKPTKPAATTLPSGPSTEGKPKPKPLKKKAKADFFASDDEENDGPPAPAKLAPVKAKPQPKKKAEEEAFASDDEDQTAPAKKVSAPKPASKATSQAGSAKPASKAGAKSRTATKRAVKRKDSDEELEEESAEEVMPKKKRRV